MRQIKEPIIQNFITQMPVRFTVETEGSMILCGVWVEIDKETGKALKIERIFIVDSEIKVS